VCFRLSSREIGSIPCVGPSSVWNGMKDSGTNSGMPAAWHASITSIQRATGSLLGEIR